VREVKTVARGRAFGGQLTTAQRKAIEERAVKAATEHFETEGWFVDDVGLYEPYDLHCSKGWRNPTSR